MKHRHRMPFGAELGPDGRTRFRLWAPACRRVELALRGEAPLAMAPRGEGWFEATTAAPAGVPYSFVLDGARRVPDPASRANPDDVHGPSRVVDALAYDWQDAAWTGRPWTEAIVYELHVGTFTPRGTFAAVIDRLDYLADLGVTALELMPVADFPGARNWGYDGVLPFAPDATYGTPDDLKRLVDAAHARGLMMLLDVVYNHFGPEGNYLHLYAPQFFHRRRSTPWGAAIHFAGPVREFFVHNALYWLEEFRFDGLRLDAIHAIADDAEPDIVTEIAHRVREGPGRARAIHLVLENDRNEASRLARDGAGVPLVAAAQWNDDTHHALHVLATGETDGYYADYADYADGPHGSLARALAEGFVYQGERSAYRGHRRGSLSTGLPPCAFVNFLQSHDQVGNRACGERIGALADAPAVEAAVACLLLAPSVPMLFMGEEFDVSSPFLYFCDFAPELGAAVAAGRREEFGRFARFREAAARAVIPDPGASASFERSRLRWHELEREPHRRRRALYRWLLELRRDAIVPRLRGMTDGGRYAVTGTVVCVAWTLGDGARLGLAANFGPAESLPVDLPRGETLYASGAPAARARGVLPPWGVVAALEARDA
jgi:malto-oligosyltrehalose trehalohydrolase